MLLTDTDIINELSPSSQTGFDEARQQSSWEDYDSKLLIYPFRAEKDGYLTPIGYDLTVGESYVSSFRKRLVPLGVGEEFAIAAGETVLIKTEEYIGLPKNKRLAGLVQSKVSLVSVGFSSVAATLDTDWEGHLMVAMTNYQPYALSLRRGQAFCTALFIRCSSAATKSCNFPTNRTDIVMRRQADWLEEHERENQRLLAADLARRAQPSVLVRLLPSLVAFVFVLLVFALAFSVWGSSPALIAAVAGSVAVSQLLAAIIRELWPKLRG
ncbi:MAG: hypothetical protein QOH93_3057 [Chloroflexia bacterium]|jgi:deoxycytidine triphosphate deaminase|nr:hypothetical protein [Chloroflexia bacterium]